MIVRDIRREDLLSAEYNRCICFKLPVDFDRRRREIQAETDSLEGRYGVFTDEGAISWYDFAITRGIAAATRSSWRATYCAREPSSTTFTVFFAGLYFTFSKKHAWPSLNHMACAPLPVA